jgi:hypothetical protein
MIQSISKDLRNIQVILKSRTYLLLTLGIALLLLIVMIWLPNFSFITSFITNSDITLLSKVKFLWGSLGAFSTNFSLYSQITSVIIVLLAGINVSLLVHYFRNRMALQKAAGTSIVGVIAGFLGIGCSACGSILLTTIFGIGATAAFFGYFPYNGAEISIVSILLLVGSILYVAHSISKPVTCKIEK